MCFMLEIIDKFLFFKLIIRNYWGFGLFVVKMDSIWINKIKI